MTHSSNSKRKRFPKTSYPRSCPHCLTGWVVLEYDTNIPAHSLTCVNCGWTIHRPIPIHPAGRTLEASYFSAASA